MSAVLSPAAARRVFLTLTVTRWFPVGLVVGILTLWPLERGLTVPEALAATSLTGITVFLLELPTSGFADAFGRRPVYVTAAVVLIASTVVFFTATAWWQFALAAVLTGVFRALDSGPLEAWFVDTVHVTEPGADVDRDLSRQGTVLGSAIAIGALISGGLVWWHPIASQSALLLPGLLYLRARRRPSRRRPRHPQGARPARARTTRPGCGGPPPRCARRRVVVREGLSLLRHNHVLGGLVAVELFWSAGMVVFETFQPIRLAQLLGSEDAAAAVMGPVASGGWGLFALGAALAAVGSRRLGVVRTAILARVLNGLGAVVMGLVAGPVALIAAYAVTYTLHGDGGAGAQRPAPPRGVRPQPLDGPVDELDGVVPRLQPDRGARRAAGGPHLGPGGDGRGRRVQRPRGGRVPARPPRRAGPAARVGAGPRRLS